MCNMCIVSTVTSVRVVGNVSVRGVNKVELRKKKKKTKKKNLTLNFWSQFFQLRPQPRLYYTLFKLEIDSYFCKCESL